MLSKTHKYYSDNYCFLTQSERLINFFNKTKEEYNLPLVTEDNKEQFYYPNAYEIKERPGYYYIPFEGSVYAINKQGEVINIANGNVLKSRINKEGYISYGLYSHSKKKDNAIKPTINQHRTLALLFIPKPDRHLDKNYSELEVNHKDGIKTNNELNNFEWVTPIENMDHAVINGLSIKAGVAKPVLIKNIITGEIKRYPSLGSCADEFNINRDNLNKHLQSNNYGLVSVDNYIFKYDNVQPWPSRPPIVKNNRGYFTVTPDIIVKNVTTGDIFICKSIAYAAKKLNITREAIVKHFKKYGRDIPYKSYLFSSVGWFNKTL